ncbi:uncharacterized protein BXZ73DRAFT_55579 [Epithele typhae]|uniref:uncharacterized protein n=1 Tax=Epithele typhae TaxID=378194 RepID=UPI00200764A8|nr:uncharacterized protein BXZ73DRAFT_56164 [Epithele typhae]XP_047872205.1 uncharacterized protein BXZ73DRAFT_55579 [Epithele typhae]KAH9912531.1 hypothetical protein BXZ73DRAFT_56164 [Epithele typhae]KAH9913351.1 hypothetical protein BXZ73DRAFT_55579 [Epithele typhae]
MGHVRCFGHVVQLISWGLLKQFEPRKRPKKKGNGENPDDSGAEEEDCEGAAEEDEEEFDENGDVIEEMEDEEEDDDDGEGSEAGEEGDVLVTDDNAGLGEVSADEWVDEMAGMTPDELAEFYKSVRPVRGVLTKIRRLAVKIRKSTTKLLPAWKKHLIDRGFAVLMIPRDVRTRWNSTFDMLKMVLRLKIAIRSFTVDDGDHGIDLGEFALSRAEWTIVEQLVDVLKVSRARSG